jgi:hypothetical protein
MNDTTQDTPEADPSIISLIKKVKALSERGVAGEAAAAKAKLDQLLKKYKINLDDIFVDNDYHFYVFTLKSTLEEDLLVQITCATLGVKAVKWSAGSKGYRRLRLTPLQYADIDSQFQHYRKIMAADWAKLKSQFTAAFFYRNNIFGASSNEQHELTPEETEKLLETLALSKNMTRKPWLKAKGLIEG